MFFEKLLLGSTHPLTAATLPWHLKDSLHCEIWGSINLKKNEQ